MTSTPSSMAAEAVAAVGEIAGLAMGLSFAELQFAASGGAMSMAPGESMAGMSIRWCCELRWPAGRVHVSC